MSENNSNGEKRVVSFFIWDPELERKIDCEVKMIDGISKLLNVATTVEQTIECNKALVLSQQRMLAFMAEIKRKQQNLLKRDNLNLEPTKATVILSDIRLPLTWTNMKKAKSDQKKFAVFCLARIGCEIIDTQMKFIDKQSTDVLFTDNLTFGNVPHDFQLHLEIYALNKSLAVSTAAKDFADRYSYFSTHGSPKIRRKVPENETTDKKTSTQQQSKFVLIARAIYTKESVHKIAKVRSLTMERLQENPLNQLPIEHSFISRFVIQPLCYTRSATFTGIVENNNISYSCALTGGFLNGEEIMRNNSSDQRTFSIPITQDTIILSRNDHLSFSIYNRGFDQEEFFVQDLFILNIWLRALQQHIVDIRAWEQTTEHLPSIRRYSYQPIITSSSSTNLTKKSALKTKARSLENIYQTGVTSQLITTNALNPSKNISYTSDHYSTDDDDNDNDNVSVFHTRL
ncbi:unnamed protein product [Adineta steineri]|uniref:Anillin homology domain-containing protein n=1 Tax=Adineta steineri TaxID=433720 RepID=A0A814PCR2_9BILA|nr:unnamed protein product [Adineta steineri]CAF1312883.1 unnamed protein product [Adineta steineri]CAF1313746.1 unnamed protein product [Adineta steineri]